MSYWLVQYDIFYFQNIGILSAIMKRKLNGLIFEAIELKDEIIFKAILILYLSRD